MIVKLSSFSPNINTSPAPALRSLRIVLGLCFSFPLFSRLETEMRPCSRLFEILCCSNPLRSDPRGDADLILVVSICNEIRLSAYPRWGMCLLKVRIHPWCETYMTQNQEVWGSWCERRGASQPTPPLFHPLLCPLPSPVSRKPPQ